MNEQARKMARRAELEFILTDVWNSHSPGYSFARWLVAQTDDQSVYSWQDEAKELIALYESEPTGEREGL